MPAEAFAFLNDGIVRRAERCWRRLLCAHIFGRTFGVLSSPCAQITALSGGCRSFTMVMGQFSVIFEYRPGTQHANVDGMSRQCGQCSRPDCPVFSSDSRVIDVDSTTVMLDQPFSSSEMGDSMDADLVPELSGETWMAATLLEELTADLPPVASNLDLLVASRQDATLPTVRESVQSGATQVWSECSGLSPELRCWRLQIGNLSVDMEGRLWRRRAPPSGASQLVRQWCLFHKRFF